MVKLHNGKHISQRLVRNIKVSYDDHRSIDQVQVGANSHLLLAMILILHALNHIIGNSMPVLYPVIIEEFHLSYVQLGLIHFSVSFFTGLSQIFISLLRHWFSGHTLLGLGNLLYSISNIIIIVTRNFKQFLILNIIGGIGNGAQHPIGTSMLTIYTDPSRRGKILGLNQTFSMLASTLAPILTAWLLLSYSWKTTLSILTVPALVSSLLLLIFVKGSREMDDKLVSTYLFGGFLELLKNRNFLLISSVRIVTSFRMGVQVFIPLYLIESLGFNMRLSSTLYSMMIFGGVLGSFFWGYLSDRVDRRFILIGTLVCSSVLFFNLTLEKSVFPLVLVLFLIGFMINNVVMQSILSESTDNSRLEQVFGIYFTLGIISGSISSISFGYIVSAFGFSYGFTAFAVLIGISIIPSLFIT